MSRPARITIDAEALRHNHRVLRRLHGGRILSVLKANAYGHGAVACARALADADGFAVAFGDEATALRAARQSDGQEVGCWLCPSDVEAHCLVYGCCSRDQRRRVCSALNGAVTAPGESSNGFDFGVKHSF